MAFNYQGVPPQHGAVYPPQRAYNPAIGLDESSWNALGLNFIGPTWWKPLSGEFSKPYFNTLGQYVMSQRRNRTIYPLPEQTFAWTQHCSIDAVKVVIVGQDPYPGPNQANGLCFSNSAGIQGSLRNIHKELVNEGFGGLLNGDLTGWAKQGVLLLNRVLTVRARSPYSHSGMGWEEFTEAVIRYISSKSTRGIVFLLCGEKAKALWSEEAKESRKYIKKPRFSKYDHCILTCSHPSSHSATISFLGCNHFSGANQFLINHGDAMINW